MLQTDRLTNTALKYLVMNMTEGQKLISTLSKFELENFEKLCTVAQIGIEVDVRSYMDVVFFSLNLV